MKRTLALMLVLFISCSLVTASAQNLRSEHLATLGDYVAAVLEDGTVKAVGDNEYGQCNTAHWRNVTAISVSLFHTLGLKSDGTVYAAGDNRHGQCRVENWKDIKMVAAGWHSSFGLKKDGTIVHVGLSDAAEITEISEWSDIVWIGTMIEDSLFAIDKYGKVYGTGMDLSQLQNVVQVYEMLDEIIFLFEDGTMKRLSANSDYSKLVDVDYHGSKNLCEVTFLNSFYVALCKDGTVITEMENADFSDWIDIVEIDADLGVKSDGSIIVLDEWVDDYPPRFAG